MTYRNWRILTSVFFVCMVCAIQAHRIRGLGDIGFAIDMIEQNYVEPVDRQLLYKSAMSGIASSLDPFSGYIPAEQFGPFQSQLSQEFGGLGIMIEPPTEGGKLTIVTALFGSPAAKAGILPGDQIEKINGESAQGLSVQDASRKLRGVPGSFVELTIARKNVSESLQLRVERAIIETESVTGDLRNADGRWEFMMQADPNIAYVRVEIFGEKTTTELVNALRSVRENAKGFILDLRDNSGGLLPTATDLCDMFLDEGVIVSIVGRFGVVESTKTATLGVELKNEVPMVILINHDSASASEVTAGCLQDLHRAIVIGERSFGKGSVQNVVAVEGGNAALRLTSAHYYPPSGRNIHRPKDAKESDIWGIHPDEGFLIPLTDDQTQKVFNRLRRRSNSVSEQSSTSSTEESRAGLDDNIAIEERDPSLTDDPQLQAAVKFLQERTATTQGTSQ